MDERPAAVSSTELVEDLFRKEYAHLVSALTRVLGPSNVPLAEDVVHDALVSAMHAWRFGLPQDPKAWIIRAAHNRAIDIIRREQRYRSFLPELATTTALTATIEAALAPAAENVSQLAMMFAVCDPGLNRETHMTLILRWLCGLSPKEIGQAFLVDTQTIDRRLHRGRGRLRQLGRLPDVADLPDIGARRDSVLRSLYLLFNEGYHGSNPQDPVRPFLCDDALRLTELLLDAKATAHPDVHALAALFCFDAARLSTRLDEHGVFVPLEDQDRNRWDRARIERGLMHLARSATGDHMSRWHLEAGIACEHAIAPSIQKTDWDRIIGFYQVLAQQSWSPIVALNRALAVAERDGIDAGRRELIALAGERKLSRYPFYWAARADLERRAGCWTAAREYYEQAIALARSPAERESFERRIESMETSLRVSGPWSKSGLSSPPNPRRNLVEPRPVSAGPARLPDVADKRHRRSTAMRKIINSAFVSLDGVTANPGSWAIFDPDAAEEAVQALQALGGMLMGRGTYEYFADVMPKQTGPYADAINTIRKYVFSSTLESADWNNSTLIRDDVVTAVTELKQEDGGDLMMYGYGRLSQTLLAHHLVDEIRFSIHPVLVGGGATGGGNGETLRLKLLGATPAPSGVVALTYQPASS